MTAGFVVKEFKSVFPSISNKACLHSKQGFFALQTRLVCTQNKASFFSCHNGADFQCVTLSLFGQSPACCRRVRTGLVLDSSKHGLCFGLRQNVSEDVLFRVTMSFENV